MKDDIDNTLDIFKALSCRVRYNIVVGLIKINECNVSRMSEHLKIPQPNVSQHLTVLKNAGVIEGYRNGNQVCYKVINETVRKIIQAIQVNR